MRLWQQTTVPSILCQTQSQRHDEAAASSLISCIIDSESKPSNTHQRVQCKVDVLTQQSMSQPSATALALKSILVMHRY
jgi:hypothetical protein